MGRSSEWVKISVVNLGGTIGGKTPSKANNAYWIKGTVPWVSPKDMKKFEIHGSEDCITDHAVFDAGMTLLPAGSVLMVSRSGILAHTFPVAVTRVSVTINQDVKAVLPIRDVYSSRYLAYAFRAMETQILNKCTKSGTTVASLQMALLEQLEVPFAPILEQRRIADKLDVVLARVDACRERLNRITVLLRRFRQSVLLAATEGRMTKAGTNHWSSVELADVALDFSYGSSAKSSPSGRVAVLRMGNIRSGTLDWSDLVFSDDEAEIIKYKLLPGDVLFNRTNSPELVGKTAVYKGERPAIYAGYLIRIRCSAQLHPDYLNYCLGSVTGRAYCWSVKSDGVSQSNINAKKLAAFPLSLPSFAEQTEIVRRVDRLLAHADRIEARLNKAYAAVDRLTPALLAKAFRGELVPQDPNDEPAAKLLERLRQTRDDSAPVRGRRRRTAETPCD